jgi:drug/metabolite transporter (DMT)-like permease
MKRRNFLIGIAICFIGSICFSSKAVLVKLAYRETTVDPVSLLALRMIFSLPFFVFSAFIISGKDTNIKFSPLQWAKVALVGCLGYYVSSLLDFIGLQFVTAGIERLILFIYPTLVLLITAVIYKERIFRRQWLALALSYGGLVLAFAGEVYFNKDVTPQFIWGSIAIFACAFTFATYIVGSGRLIPTIGAAKFNSYAMGFAAIGVIAHYLLSSKPSLLHLATPVYFYSFLMAIVGTVIPSYLVSEGISRIGSNNAAIVSSAGPISTIIQAYFFLNESITSLQLAGTVLTLVGILIISLKKRVEK